MQTSAKACNNKKVEIRIFLYPDDNSDHSQNLMGSTLNPDPSSDFYFEIPTSSICVILLTNKQIDKQSNKPTNGHEDNTFLVEVKLLILLINRSLRQTFLQIPLFKPSGIANKQLPNFLLKDGNEMQTNYPRDERQVYLFPMSPCPRMHCRKQINLYVVPVLYKDNLKSSSAVSFLP